MKIYNIGGGIEMNKKVSLKEIVGTKVVFAVIIALYYWMWVRTDWKDYYQTIQIIMGMFFLVFFMIQVGRIKKYKQEGIDEMAEKNLRRCDSICLKLFIIVLIVIAWVCAIMEYNNIISTSVIGWVIILSIVAISIIRTILFVIMDNKGV